ncbi:MAG: DUF1801 domain-containing protein [Balneolaceae bacterium]
MAKTDFKTVDEYIAIFPDDVQKVLQNIRHEIQKAVPDATEVISYQMPAFRLNGILVWYAAWKKHIGLYPRTSGIEAAFANELSEYEGSKGTTKFPLDKPIPYDLISRIAKFRVQENLQKEQQK